jgi:hypothetical protein
MVPRPVQRARVIVEIERGIGPELFRDLARQRLVPGNAARDPDALDEGAAIGIGGQIVRVDARMHADIGRRKPDLAAAFGAQLADRHGEGGKRMHALAGAVGRPWLHVELDVGGLDMRAGAHEPGGEAGGHRHRAGTEQRIFQRDPGLIEQAAHLVVEGRINAFEDQPRLQMVLQVAAHAGAVGQHLYAVLAQMFGLADPRGHQQMRRADGPRADDHLGMGGDALFGTRGVAPGHADRARAVEHDPAGRGTREDPEIPAPPRGLEKRDRRRTAPPVLRGQLEISDAVLRSTVVIGVERIARFLRGGDPRVAYGPLQAHVRHVQRALIAVIRVRAALLPLGPLEQRQHLVPAPAGIAHLRPAVVILRLPAHVEQPVERRRPAQHLAARPVERAPVQPRIGFGTVAPVDARVVHRLEVADRDVDPRVPVAPARFHQDDRDPGIRREAIRQHAPRGPGPDDDIIR